MVRCPFGNARSLALLVSVGALLLPKPLAADDFASKQHQQRQVREDTDRLVRRLDTMIRVLDYHQIDPAAQKQVLAEAAVSLEGLSREQMDEIIRRLGAAAVARDDSKSDKELEAAYQRHREVILTLRALLDRHEAIRSLDEAAERLEKMAKDQLEHHLQTADLIDEAAQRLKGDPPAGRKQGQPTTLAMRQQADEQADLHTDLGKLLKQTAALKPQLPIDEQDRLQLLQKQARERHVVENLALASEKLRATGYPENRLKEWTIGNDLQWQTAHDLQELARSLRPPADRLAALSEARDRLDRAVPEQDNVAKETRSQENRSSDASDMGKLRELSKQQARLAFDTAATRSLLQPHAKGLADKLEPAKDAMAQAMKALRQNEPARATKPQAQAAATLKAVRDKLAEMIAQTPPPAGQINPADAAQQLAKAIEQAQQAAGQSQQAAKQMPTKPGPAAQAMAQSQKATQAAMNSLGQAQAQAPPMVQGSLKQAAKQLAQATQQLGQAKPGQANQSQHKAITQMSKALQALNAAAAAMGQPSAAPGQAATAAASAAGQGQGQGKGQGQGSGPTQAQGLGIGQGLSMQPSPGTEKNQGQGLGNRIADGRLNNAPSQLANVRGDGSFLHLPPRQRQLIHQAAGDRLPPEYAPLIQQYFMNLARGRPAVPLAPTKR